MSFNGIYLWDAKHSTPASHGQALSMVDEVSANHKTEYNPAFVKVAEAIEPFLKQADTCCFVAGTLVHTDKGLVPIQDIKVGDLVLSQPEQGGEEAYKPVISTFSSHERKEIYALRYIDNYIVPNEDSFDPVINLPEMMPSKINVEILTENHPVWVNANEDYEIKAGWKPAIDMIGGEVVILKENERGGIFSVDKLMQTSIPDVFFVGTNGDYIPFVIDLRNQKRDVYYIAHLVLEAYGNNFESEEHMPLSDNIIIGNLELHGFLEDIIELLRNPIYISASAEVFNIEVADNHTYYVGEKGLWVHNTNWCSPSHL